jgi:hypothetical protein
VLPQGGKTQVGRALRRLTETVGAARDLNMIWAASRRLTETVGSASNPNLIWASSRRLTEIMSHGDEGLEQAVVIS